MQPLRVHDNFWKKVAMSRKGESIFNRTSGLDALQITPGFTQAQMGNHLARFLVALSNRSVDYDDDPTKFCRR